MNVTPDRLQKNEISELYYTVTNLVFLVFQITQTYSLIVHKYKLL